MAGSGGAVAVGGGGGNALLLALIDSPHFSLFWCVSYLQRYADNIGIHHYLCRKLRSFPGEEIEFFLPQLVQLHITVETESMALEDLLLDLCQESTHCTLLVFWQLQAHLTELGDDPESYGFQVSKRLFNKLQYLLFNVGEEPDRRLRENTAPVTVMSGALAAVAAMPAIAGLVKPVVVSQGRKQRSHIFHVASRLIRSKSLSGVKNGAADGATSAGGATNTAASSPRRGASASGLSEHARTTPYGSKHEALSMPDLSTSEERDRGYNRGLPARSRSNWRDIAESRLSVDPAAADIAAVASSAPVSPRLRASSGDRRIFSAPMSADARGPPSAAAAAAAAADREAKIKMLKTNYFRCETQFMYALQSISTRLMQVPKQARLAALRVELALLNRDLPAEVDIPLLLPTDTRSPRARHNRIVRVAPAEATVLNSAEKVPFLMLIEYLREDIDFDPDTEANKAVLAAASDRRYIFDMAYLHKQHSKQQERGRPQHSRTTSSPRIGPDDMYSADIGLYGDENVPMEEKDMGDINVISLFEDQREIMARDALSASVSSLSAYAARPANTASPRASDLSFSSNYMPSSPAINAAGVDNVDVTEIASHMRTAAVMLTQLDNAGSSNLPKDEVASIRAKIIANMQSMEVHTVVPSKGLAGERRMENDLKTAGISKSDDPSAANLGEDWTERKERIRRQSPYGHLPNWDLFSAIAKTGFDLRQESFACQLIQAMMKLWSDENVDVWVKRMRILITADAYGLVETITNGLSIHSIKKALTTASIAAGTNPNGSIATLTDYFVKTFGDRGTPRFEKALDCFVKSLAAYSVVCYILQVKDRHNGNILLDNEGHIIHIDFGFLLSNTPGRFGFEAAPFKLTQEYVDLMGGLQSEHFEKFKSLLRDAFKAIRRYAEDIIMLVEMMSRDSTLPCFSAGPATSLQLRQRFQLHLSDPEVDQFVDNVLIQKSYNSVYTRLYDQFQLHTQGIYL